MNKKICNKCNEEKSISEFGVDRNTRDGYNYQCKACRRQYYSDNKSCIIEYSLKYRESNREQIRVRARQYYKSNNGNNQKRYMLLKTYNITEDQYDEMVKDQNGVCAICGNPETTKKSVGGKVYKLSVDHNHTTGTVRELLCQGCNTIIGRSRENPKILRAAADYIEKWNCQTPP